MNFGALKFGALRHVAKWNIRLREHRILGEVYEIIDGTIADYIRDHGLIYAAAVSFYALLSLIPFLILFASAAGFLLAYVGVGTGDESDRILADVVEQLRRAIPYLQPEFENDLKHIVTNRTGLGIAGFIGLLLASSQVFRALEFAFARIFARRIEKRTAVVLPRSLIVSKLLFGGFIVALVFAFLLFQIFIKFLKDLAEMLPDVVSDLLGVRVFGESVFTHVITGMAVVLGFATLMKMFTKQKVKLKFALVGGVVFFVLWQTSRNAYDIYISQFTDLVSLYGGFATMMVIVLWVFFSSSLLILVGEFVQTIQRRFIYGPKWPKGRKGNGVAARRIDAVERDEEKRAQEAEEFLRLDAEELSVAFGVGLESISQNSQSMTDDQDAASDDGDDR